MDSLFVNKSNEGGAGHRLMIQSIILDGQWLVIDIDECKVKEGNCVYFPEYNSVILYIKKNKDIFMKHWNGEIDDLDLIWNLR